MLSKEDLVLDWECSLQPPRLGGSNEQNESIFEANLIKISQNVT